MERTVCVGFAKAVIERKKAPLWVRVEETTMMADFVHELAPLFGVDEDTIMLRTAKNKLIDESKTFQENGIIEGEDLFIVGVGVRQRPTLVRRFME